MNKSTLITSIGILVAIFSQLYWLHGSYQSYTEKYQQICNEIFATAIDLEVNYRWANKPINLKNPKLIIKSAKDMTPEERANLKGDTIRLDRAKKKNLGKRFTELLQQKIQDDNIIKRPLNIQLLDSLFNSQFTKADLPVFYQIYQYDKDHQVTHETKHKLPGYIHYIYTDLKPIGTQGLMFVQAKIGVPVNMLLRNMLFSLIVSTLMVALLIYCLYKQLWVINRTRKQLQEREDALHHAIHDLKTPLNTTYTLVDYLLKKEMEDKWTRVLTNNKKQIKKLLETIDSMLILTLNNEQRQPLKLQNVNLVELANNCYETVAQLYPDKQHLFKIDSSQLPSPEIRTEIFRLERCLRNLIENAFKYSDEGVEIRVKIESNKKQCMLSVTDTGWGIPAKELKKLGKQFYRVQRSGKPVTSGYGIGLSCVMQLTKELGGKLSFSSKEHEGSIFMITLPLHE